MRASCCLVLVALLCARGDDFDDVDGDPYDLLGVAYDATSEEVKKAYRTLAKRWHPDKVAANKPRATKQFAKLSRAYEVVGESRSRRKFDKRARAKAASKPPAFDFDDLRPPGVFGRQKTTLPPKRTMFERGGFGGVGRFDESFVPSWTKRGTRRVTRVGKTVLPDGTVVAEGQDYELRNDQWFEVGKPYAWTDDAKSSKLGARLEPAKPLFLGDRLVSRDRSHVFELEIDGNARVREVGSRTVVWETGSRATAAAGGDGFLLLQRDGNLLLCSGQSPKSLDSVVWASNSADSAADGSFLELNELGELLIMRRTADNAYTSCAWGSAGCGYTLRSTSNSIRVYIRKLFSPGALRRTPTKEPSVLASIMVFFRFMMGFPT